MTNGRPLLPNDAEWCGPGQGRGPDYWCAYETDEEAADRSWLEHMEAARRIRAAGQPKGAAISAGEGVDDG